MPMPHFPLHDTLKGEEGVANAIAILTWLILKTMQNPQVHVLNISPLNASPCKIIDATVTDVLVSLREESQCAK